MAGSIHEIHHHIARASRHLGLLIIIPAFSEAPPYDEGPPPQLLDGHEAPVAAVGGVVAVVAHGEDATLGHRDGTQVVLESVGLRMSLHVRLGYLRIQEWPNTQARVGIHGTHLGALEPRAFHRAVIRIQNVMLKLAGNKLVVHV